MKSIETILKLSKNPFYIMSKEDLDILYEYNENLVKHSTYFEKNNQKIDKHKAYLEVEK